MLEQDTLDDLLKNIDKHSIPYNSTLKYYGVTYCIQIIPSRIHGLAFDIILTEVGTEVGRLGIIPLKNDFSADQGLLSIPDRIGYFLSIKEMDAVQVKGGNKKIYDALIYLGLNLCQNLADIPLQTYLRELKKLVHIPLSTDISSFQSLFRIETSDNAYVVTLV